MSSGICYLPSLDNRCTDFELQELQTSTNQNQTMKYVTFMITDIEQNTPLQQNNRFMNLKASKKQHLNMSHQALLTTFAYLIFKTIFNRLFYFYNKGK